MKKNPFINENVKQKKKLNLLARQIIYSMLPNTLGAFLILFYSIFSVRIPSWQYIEALKYVVPMILGAEFLLSPFMNYLLLGKISHQLELFYENRLSEKEVMNLFTKLSKVPMIFGIEVLCFFVSGALFVFSVYLLVIRMEMVTALLCFLEMFYCSCLIGGVSFTYTRALCKKDLLAVAAAGLDEKEVMKKKRFGGSLLTQVFLFVLLPVITTGLLALYVVWMAYYPLSSEFLWPNPSLQITRMISICTLNFLAQTAFVWILDHQMNESNKVMMTTLEDLEDDLNSNKVIDTDLHDELSYNQYLANMMLNYLKNILSETFKIGESIAGSAQELQAVSTETESTALEQSSATSEIVSTMEEANNLSKDIEEKIGEVSNIAVQTAEDVQALYEILEKNLQKMAQIQTANQETIEGINDVNEKMNSIWEIINIINSIADTTKIIAFNAELEATNVREKGRNFKNVANEIRRLANGTMDSTKEIKDIINDIQGATDKLKEYSAISTTQINNGMVLAHSLENSFTTINESASESAESSAEIKIKIEQETEAFKQILITLQQISKSIDSFSSSTQLVGDAAADLQVSVHELNCINNDEAAILQPQAEDEMELEPVVIQNDPLVQASVSTDSEIYESRAFSEESHSTETDEENKILGTSGTQSKEEENE